nr:MAG TPA: hypothetical protein [Caudoviricetes sp.]
MQHLCIFLIIVPNKYSKQLIKMIIKLLRK